MLKKRFFVLLVSAFLLSSFFILLCSCRNAGVLKSIEPATLDEFKEAATKYGLDSKLEPLKSEENKTIGYSIKNGSSSQISNLIFYDVRNEENIDKVYPTCVNSVKHISSLEHITASVTEGSGENYEYIQASDFKVDDKYNIELPIQLSYAIKVDCTCLYMDAYPAEYDAYTSVAKELGYMV